jgi:pimeloyl-ACP methyl ester carboxylesterase
VISGKKRWVNDSFVIDSPKRDEVKSTSLSILGLDVFVREQGDGPPILLLNGLGAGAEAWAWLEERLAERARTIAIELPGAGRSATPPLPLPISTLARVAATALERLDCPQADVIGFSLGGIVAQQLARDEPARVRRLVLAATACGWGSIPGSLAALTLISLPWRLHSAALYRQTQALMGSADRDLLRRRPELSEARLRQPPPILGYTYQLAAGASWSSLAWLHEVRAPTLVLSGGRDELVPPANGVQLARLLPQSRLHVLPDEGHLFMWDPETAAVPLIADFLGSAEPTASAAWADGVAVDDDASVEAAFAAADGAQPHRALSMAFRRLVEQARS